MSDSGKSEKALGALVFEGRSRLALAGVDTPDLDARALLLAVTGLDLATLIAQPETRADAGLITRYDAAIARRAAGEPVARIIGVREFWGLPFHLDADTLEPRPDSETLVEAALAVVPDRAAPLRLLDLGTGSGCLLVALLSELPGAFGIGVDVSAGAAHAARANALANGVANRAAFVAMNWVQAFLSPARFDLVISNPPYIETGALDGLMREVRGHDPARALDGGADGLDAYRVIVAALPGLLVPGGGAVLELGAGQAVAVSALAEAAGLEIVGVRADLGGIARVLTVRKRV